MKRVVLAVLSVALALFTNTVVRSLVEERLTPVGEKCFSGDYEGLIPFEPYLGGTFICIITTFFHDLAIAPEGTFAFGLLATVVYPLVALIVVEASRTGVRGILKYPVATMVIGQYIAISVAIPLIWVPFYVLWGRGAAHEFSKYHLWYVIFTTVWLTGISIAFFNLDTQTYSWTFFAGLLGGPFLHIPLIGQWFMPTNQSNPDASSRLVGSAYTMTMVCSFILWAYVVQSLLKDVGYDASALYETLWGGASYAVKMIMVDALVLFMALLIVIWVDHPAAALQAIAMAPLVGPGAVLAHALGKKEKLSRQGLKRD